MKSIMKHLYAKHEGTELFSSPSVNAKSFAKLSKGAWIGVVAEHGPFYSVITMEGNGYLLKSQTYAENGFKLRVLKNPNGGLRYAV